MNRAAHAIPAQPRQVEGLGNHSLARERRVTVDAQRQHETLVAIGGRSRHPLMRARHAAHHRIHDFQVARIRCELQRHGAVANHALALEAEVVLHVTGRRIDARLAGPSLELAEHLVVRHPHHVHKHVDAPPMGHPDHDAPRTTPRRAGDRLVEHRHHRIGAFNREPLVALILPAEKSFETVHFGEAAQHGDLLVGRERLRERALLHRVLEPRALRLVPQVRELEGDRAAVDAAQPLDDVGRRARREPECARRHPREVVVGDAMELGRELDAARRRRAEGIQLHGQMAVLANRFHQRGGSSDASQQAIVISTSATADTGERLGRAEELTPGFVHRRRVTPVALVRLGDVRVVEHGGGWREAGHGVQVNKGRRGCARALRGGGHCAPPYGTRGRAAHGTLTATDDCSAVPVRAGGNAASPAPSAMRRSAARAPRPVGGRSTPAVASVFSYLPPTTTAARS